MKVIKGVIALALLMGGANTARADVVSGFDVIVNPGSNCSQADLTIVASGSGITTAASTVTTTDGVGNFSTGNVPSPVSSVNGSFQHTIAFPGAVTPGNLVAVEFKLGTGSLDTTNDAAFFAVYDCSTGVSLHTCAGQVGSCGSSISDYYPKIVFPEDFGAITRTVNEPGDDYTYIALYNFSVEALILSNLKVTGPQADFFTVELANDSYYASVAITAHVTHAGTYQAEISFDTNDPAHPTLTAPITVVAKKQPRLKVDIRNAGVVDKGGQKIIAGKIRVQNLGFGKSLAGGRLSVNINNYASASVPKQVLLVDIPAIKPGRAFFAHFESSGHIIKKGEFSKIVAAKISGSPKQIGRPPRYYTWDGEYVSY